VDALRSKQERTVNVPTTTYHSPRLTYLEPAVAAKAFVTFWEEIQELLRLIKDEPERLLQRQYYSLSHSYTHCALYSYGFGLPLSEVRGYLASAAQAFSKVVELR